MPNRIVASQEFVPRLGGNNSRHGESLCPEWRTWSYIRVRCGDPKTNRWKMYGGRGIIVCDRWRESYENFLEDILREIGRRPGPCYSIERIKNDRGYEPGNVKWANAREQARNTRRNIWIEHDGSKKLMIEVCESLGFPYWKASQRKRRGWSDRELFEPSGYRRA